MGNAELATGNVFISRGLPTSQFPEMHEDNHEGEKHQRFDEREAQNQGQLDAVVRARIAGHAFACSGRDATLADSAKSRRYSEPYARADVAKPLAYAGAFSSPARRLREGGQRRKEHGRQSEAETNQITLHC